LSNIIFIDVCKQGTGNKKAEAGTEYGIWGGVPMYWEIRKSSGTLDNALEEHLINQYGLLADEPERLFSDESYRFRLPPAFRAGSTYGEACNTPVKCIIFSD